MNEIKNVLICGLGAIGSIYADKISKYDENSLKILVDESRYQKYINEPKIFNKKELKLNYILPDNCENFKADLIIISTKSDGLNTAINNIKNFINDNTIIMSLLNGVTSEKIIAQEYGWKHILLSYYIGHSAVRINNNITFDGIGDIVFGANNYSNNIKDVQLVKNYFDKIGVDYKIPDDIYHALWLKYILNVSSNQLSAVLRLTFGQMQTSKKVCNVLKNIMNEVVQIAKAEGVKNTELLIDEAFENFEKMSPEGKTSMLQDVEAKRKTEVDIFSGTVIELGKKYNILTPYNNILKELIDIIHENY